MIENNTVQQYTRLGASLPGKGNRAGSQNVVRLQEIGSGQSPKKEKRKFCQFSVVLGSVIWIS
jgi:hypothetical protein